MRKKVRSKRKTAWRLWASALGEKSGRNDWEANVIAAIRTFLFLSYLVTNVTIVAGVVRHWDENDNHYHPLKSTTTDGRK